VLVTLAAISELPLTRKFIAAGLPRTSKKLRAVERTCSNSARASPRLFSPTFSRHDRCLIGWRKGQKTCDWDALASKLANSSDAVLRDRIRD